MKRTFCNNCDQEIFDSVMAPMERRPFSRIEFKLGKPVSVVFAIVQVNEHPSLDICHECAINALKTIY